MRILFPERMKRLVFLLFIPFVCHSQINTEDIKDKADWFTSNNQPDSAFYYLKLLQSTHEKNGDSLNLAKTLNNQGILYKQIGEFDLATEAHLRALRIFEAEQQERLIAASMINIAELYNALFDFSKAHGFISKAEKIILKSENIPEKELYLSYTYTNYGITMQGLNNHDSAMIFYNKSLELSTKLSDSLGIAYDLNNIGTVYSDKGQHLLALKTYQESLKIKVQLKHQPGIAKAFENIGKALSDLGRFDEAMMYFDSAIAISSALNLKYIEASIHYNISASKSKSGEFQAALKHLQTGLTITDSLDIIAEKKHINVLQVAHDYDKQRNQIELSNTKIRLLENQDKIRQGRLNVLIYSLIGMFILISALVFALRLRKRNYNQKEELHQQKEKLQKLEYLQLKNALDLKNRELSAHMLNELAQKEVLQKLKQTLEDKAIDSSNIQLKFKEVSRHIDGLIDDSSSWDAFKRQFEAVHSGFFETLNQTHGDLSQNDIRHCAYIKIGLTTKEIAALLNVTTAAVQKSRVRLKKKLNLNKETDLVTYVKSID